MEALCSRLGRSEEARTFAGLARRLWAKADPEAFEFLRDDLHRRAARIATATSAASGSR
jgi:hypothetical protein